MQQALRTYSVQRVSRKIKYQNTKRVSAKKKMSIVEVPLVSPLVRQECRDALLAGMLRLYIDSQESYLNELVIRLTSLPMTFLPT